MFGENIRLRSINAERTRCLNYCRQTNRCRNDARLLTRAMWILNWRYGFHARSSLLQLAAFPRGGLTPAEAPLIDAEILFRQPQPPNCYRLDDPGVGRFIAYSDVWNWRAECISLQETLPIDEAGSRAENTIRDICMNTPEKLTMLGFYKGDPELKPITPQAMAGLSINPLRGQLKTDLKAVGYRREYGAATKGDEDGPVIWTGLCFDRKQLVEAFVTGAGNGPPTHTPAAQPTQPRERTPRKQPLRE